MISLCLTNYNRYEMLLESFQNVLNDKRLSEIIILDDCSDYNIFRELLFYSEKFAHVKLYRNVENIGMSRSKAKAIGLASNEWVIIFDSDNKIDSSYLDAIPKKLESDVIYCPSFARPEFDYRSLQGKLINKKNIKEYIDDKAFTMCLNTCNYLVHKESYLKTYQYDKTIKASDTIHFNYLWLKSLGSFYIVPGMEYFHRVHKASGFLADAEYNLKKAEETRKLIEKL